MAKIDELITKLENQGTVIGGIDVLVQTLSDDLKEALKPDAETEAKIDAAFAKALANDQKLTDALLVGTPEDPGPTDPPDDGKKNVVWGFDSKGKETFSIVAKNGNITEARAEFLSDIHDTALTTAAAQDPGGSQFESDVYCTGGENQSYDNAKQIAAYQLVWIDALRAQAIAQLEGA